MTISHSQLINALCGVQNNQIMELYGVTVIGTTTPVGPRTCFNADAPKKRRPDEEIDAWCIGLNSPPLRLICAMDALMAQAGYHPK